jgi:Cd2+/Zn2+-exporting ATPase
MASNVDITFTVRGIDCASCARTVETGVRQLDGVESCSLNFTTEQLRVSGAITREAVLDRVRALGYEVAEPVAEGTTQQSSPPSFLSFMWERWETRLALLGALLIVPGVVLNEILHWEIWWVEALALVTLVIAGLPIARSAWRVLIVNREININVLMTIAAIGAVVIGAYVEAGMVMVLFAIGEALEGYTSTRARHAVRSLMEVAPNIATRLEPDGREEQILVDALRVGETIIVRPGERIPMDGVVRAGAAAVNQAPITGESRPVDKVAGDEVFAGSINGEAALEITVTRLAEDNTISRMIQLVAEAQERRAPAERFIEGFARWYTPAVVVLALLVATVPPLFFGQPFWNPTSHEFGWFYRALALLVVACPCALVISTPVSIVSALSTAARSGVLIKGGAYLEALSRVRAIAFDKTGTLTNGQPQVVGIRSVACNGVETPCAACDDTLALAHAVERRSEHPLARAITSAALERELGGRYPPAEGVTALVGRGVGGRVVRRDVLVGSHTYFDMSIPHAEEHCAGAAADAARGWTPLLVSADGAYVGTIAVADTVRPSSQTAVAELDQLGLHTVMLTGDSQRTAQAIAADVGVSDVRAELLPEHKLQAVEELRKTYGPTAMVGDGINDAPALAAATVGIAIGGAHGGTNQAMETADITLMSNDLRRLPFAVRLSRAAMRTVRVNVALSLGLKLIFLVLVLLGMGTLWMAVIADVGASLLVTLNGMRLLGFRDRLRETGAGATSTNDPQVQRQETTCTIGCCASTRPATEERSAEEHSCRCC